VLLRAACHLRRGLLSSITTIWFGIESRYPQLVRFIQWEKEEQIVNSRNPEDKAKRIDYIISRFSASGGKISPSLLKKWKERVDKMKLEDFEWLKEDNLLKLLVTFNTKQSQLQKAIECNL
jgi:hypothetical protein